MPNSLSPAKTRITYTEFPDTVESIDDVVRRSRIDRSLFLRNATQHFAAAVQAGRWKPISYDSAADSRKLMVRVSYAEWTDVAKVLRKYAAEHRLDLSDVIRSAVYTYIKSMKK